MPELIEMSDILIGSAHDFNNCIGLSADESSDLQQLAEALTKHLGSEKIIAHVNRTHQNASDQSIQGKLWTHRHTYTSRVYPLYPIKDRIGSGDAFMAGLIYAFMRKKNPETAVELATAAAALKHFISGDVLVCRWEEVEQLSNQQTFGKLLR